MSYEGNPFGDWALFMLDLDGNWIESSRFKVDEAQSEGSPIMYNFSFDKPQSFIALTICPVEDNVEQTTQCIMLFFCDQST